MSATVSSNKVESSTVRNGLPRWVEMPVALCALILISPLLLVVAIVIKLTSKGPVLFKQERVGRFGVNFVLCKFRTMRVGNTGPQVTVKKDSRITWIGNILRRTKLDELPELWNIVRGDMSIVGPRPEVPNYVSLADPLWQGVLQARPGITDPVTLRLRNEEEMLAGAKDPVRYYLEILQPEKLKGYLSYLQGRNIKTDLWVIKETIVAVIFPFETPPPRVEDEHGRIVDQRQRSFLAAVLSLGRLKVIADIAILITAFVFSYLLRFEFSVPRELWRQSVLQLVVVVSIQYFILYISNIRKFTWRYISLAEVGTFVRAAILSSLPIILFRLLPFDSLAELRVPLSVTVMDSIYGFGGLMGLRIFRRLMHERYEKRQISAKSLSGNRTSVFLIGAGRAGQMAAREIIMRGDSNYVIKGFIDDDNSKQGKIILGIEVCGTTNDLPRLMKEMAVENAILTISHTREENFHRIIELCEEAQLNLRIMPGLYKLIEDHPENINVADLNAGT